MPVSSLNPYPAILLAAIAGGAATLAFAPFGWWPLQLLALALLFGMVERAASVRQAALLGLAFGCGWLLCGFYWLYISMHDFGGMPAWMAAAAVALLALALALLPASAMAGARWLQQRGTSRTLIMLGALPAGWLLTEWARGWLFTGFPWIASGYAHTASMLSGFAAVIGVYGVGFVAALLAGCLVLRNRQALALAVLVLVAGIGLQKIEWTQPHGQPITVRLLQGNVPQEMKFAPEAVQASLRLYHKLITAQAADLVATPETALPMLAHRLPVDYLLTLQQFAQHSGTSIVLGVPVSDSAVAYANSVLGIGPVTAPLQPSQPLQQDQPSRPLQPSQPSPYRYDKHHLVPFGEFIPPGARWFVQMMNIPLGDFTRGAPLQPSFAVRDQLILPNICYEDLFGEEIADQLAAPWFGGKLPATILLNASNIAWFGDTIALPQHLQISTMRSLETGRPMLRSTNTGVTAVINHRGKVVDQLKPYTEGVLSARVQGMAGWTPYMLAGNTPVIVLAALMLLLAWRSSRRAGVPALHKTR